MRYGLIVSLGSMTGRVWWASRCITLRMATHRTTQVVLASTFLNSVVSPIRKRSSEWIISCAGLSLGFLLVYYGGHKMFAQPKSEVFESSWDSPLNIVYLNSWTPENHSDVPGIGEYASTSLGSECRTATNCLYDADFLKIRNITIGYDLPEHLTEKVGISKISLRFQINDPKALWIKNNAGIDPETLGIRKQASYMFGVNLSL